MEWQVGEDVCYITDNPMSPEKKSIRRIERISNGGIITISGGVRIRKDGWEWGKKNEYYHRSQIVKLTPELKDEISHQNLSNRLAAFNFKQLPLQSLRDIFKVLVEWEKTRW